MGSGTFNTLRHLRTIFGPCLLLVDVQNTFCIPGYELFVGGQSGNGAVEDNMRLCQFIYRQPATYHQNRLHTGYAYGDADIP